MSAVSRLGDTAYALDLTAFPQAALLKNPSVLGHLDVTNKLADTTTNGTTSHLVVR